MTITSTINEMQQSWPLLFPNMEAPSERQWAVWLLRFGDDIVRRGVAKLAGVHGRSPERFAIGSELHRFGTSIMNRMERETAAAKAA